MVVGVDTNCVDCGKPMRSCALPAHCGCIQKAELEKELKGVVSDKLASEQPMTSTPVKSNERQIGGTHYTNIAKGGEQHWDKMWRKYREAWFVGNITKYVERYREKDGIRDLEKAAHYLQKLIELEKAELENIEKTCGLVGELTLQLTSDLL